MNVTDLKHMNPAMYKALFFFCYCHLVIILYHFLDFSKKVCSVKWEKKFNFFLETVVRTFSFHAWKWQIYLAGANTLGYLLIIFSRTVFFTIYCRFCHHIMMLWQPMDDMVQTSTMSLTTIMIEIILLRWSCT